MLLALRALGAQHGGGKLCRAHVFPLPSGAHASRGLLQVEEIKRRHDVEVISISRENRDQVAQQVFQRVKQQLEAAAIGHGGGGSA